MTTVDRVMGALAGVYDPELDEPITSLRFVRACEVSDDGDVSVRLRLPTPQCAPNFAFLMAADARRLVSAVPGVRGVTVTLEDHYTGDEINEAMARGDGFTGAFPGETADDDLEALRELFTRKALVARQGRIVEGLLADGWSVQRLVTAPMAELPDSIDARRCVELRAALGIDARLESPAFVSGDGAAVSAQEFERWRRMGRLVRTSLETNGGICRSLLRFRHGLSDEFEEVSR
jgi:metal-sulfur cluster biosynthetic enzyme